MLPAVVPVSRLEESKSRLRRHLGDEATDRLTLAMAGDVLEALLGVPTLGPVAVVTPDAQVARAARALGATALERPDPGLNAAIEDAVRELASDPEGGALVVLGDVPGARSDDLATLTRALDEGGGRGVALAPSRDGGTSALLRVPVGAIPAHFGPESAKAHRELAQAAGLACRELALASLALDVDEIEDLEAFARDAAGGSRTRAVLDSLDWKPRP
jgi:2-phospho-L-lactate guanylyltransferase